MKKICTLLMITALAVCGLRAQNAVMSHGTMLSRFSIVRPWQSDKYVAYSSDASSSTFCLVSPSSGAMTTADLPRGFEITDFVILDDKVFFCGQVPGSPFLGYLDINLLFADLDDFHFYRLDPMRVTRPLKISAFNVSDGRHLVGVADGFSLQGDPARVVVDLPIRSDGTLYPYRYSNMEDNVEAFDDIAVTDDCVIISGHKADADGLCLRVFGRPTSTSDNIFSPALISDRILCGHAGLITVRDGFLAAGIDGMHYSVAAIGYANGRYGLDFSIYKTLAANQASLVYRGFVPLDNNISSNWALRDISYDQQYDKLLIALDYTDAAGTDRSAVCEIASPMVPTSAVMNMLSGYSLFSACPGDTGGSFVAVGHNGAGMFSLFRHTDGNSDCHQQYSVAISSISEPEEWLDKSLIWDNLRIIPISITPIVDHSAQEIDCETIDLTH